MSEHIKKPVLVIGGGIGGIQASHDLAEMGIPVFLIENSPSIGGRMAQLDKTFPTNDCSACILAPKVTETFNHPLVHTMTWSEVLEIKGEYPNFKATIRKKARYIDEEKCKGCNDCTLACPIESKNEFELGLGKRHAVYKPFAQAAPNKVVIDKKGSSPCKYNCPAHIDAHGYVALTGAGRYEEALEVIRRVTPFAGVLGRVCFHPCENNCTRRFVESPISIAAIKRFLGDRARTSEKGDALEFDLKQKDIKVAIIGAGPAGLNCAYTLAKEGYKVTVFEKLPVGGGMLKIGIPDYRLDKSVLEHEIKLIESLGVEIRYNCPVGKDLTFDDLRKDGYKAFFIAIGAHQDSKMGIPREENPNVLSSIDFLRELNLGMHPKIGKKVVVIGGGNVAMDAARSAVRLGSEVTVVYRRTKQEMPANKWEIEHAEEEGVKFSFLTTQTEVLIDSNRNDHIIGLRCVKNELGPPDDSGRRRPQPIQGSDFTIDADTIIVAIGQKVEHTIRQAGFEFFDGYGNILAQDCRTPVSDIFAGGDAQTGPATVIEAIASGNRAAKAIINYLENKDLPIEPHLLPQTDISQIDLDNATYSNRATMPTIDIERRIHTFDEVETGLSEEQARNEALRCVDCSVCCECRACETACQSGAICHEQKDQIIELDVGAVIFSSGCDMADQIPKELGYGKYRDVVTAMEYERILSASGPYSGHVQRLSDGRPPQRVAFIQCVGSRDHQCGLDYCSSVCCMYAVKEAQITREHLPSVKQIDIYYMDMRAFGKDFDRYVVSAEQKYGVNFVRSRVGKIEENTDGTLRLSYVTPDGTIDHANYDLVVLSTGFKANADTARLLRKAGVKTDKFGFVYSDDLDVPKTTVPGLFACGAAAGPKDIPETVMEASAAAGVAAGMINTISDKIKDYSEYFKSEEIVAQRDVSREPVRIGVFVCHCGINIGGYVDVPEVCRYIRTLPFVVHVEENLYTCSVDAQRGIMERIKEYDLNRVVVASCTPRTHEPLFQAVLRKTGLNPYLLNMSNIRDQCSWVHMNDKKSATEKAKELVRMAVGKVTLSAELTRKKIPVIPSALIIGGGVAGMSSALTLANMGFKTHIVEKTNQLGGNALKLNANFDGRPLPYYINKLIHDVESNINIQIHLNTTIEKIEGYVGNYTSTLQSTNISTPVRHGVIVVATGAHERKPDEYLYGDDPRVITQLELDSALLAADPRLRDAGRVVMIQCVGSREEPRMYCSRVCCNQALRNAMALKRLNPDTEITILYRDMRSYGLSEEQYRNARMSGIHFIRYDQEQKPKISKKVDGSLIVTVFDGELACDIELDASLLVLAAAIEADEAANKEIARLLKVPTTQDGFFLEAHVKLRPVDFATEGVFVCGLAHSPRNLRESIVQGIAAAGRAATIISKESLETEGTIANVDIDYCTACGTCEKVCAYGAIQVSEITVRNKKTMKAVVNEVLCKGCGTCSANCRCGAVDIGGFSDREILNEIDYLLRRKESR
ncbi:MAG: FAD-dependent oxidoreductase [Eubacteriales bacterium]